MEPALLILLAEDEPLIAHALQDALEDAGFAVRHAPSGGDAVAALQANDPAIAGLVTDIQLGPAPDGWDVARQGREALAHLPIVYMSGDSAHEHSARGVPDSIMIQKPFASAQVVTAISTLLNAVPPAPPG